MKSRLLLASTAIAALKNCSRCKQHLPLSSFSKRRDQPDGLDYYCRACKRIRNTRTYRVKRNGHTPTLDKSAIIREGAKNGLRLCFCSECRKFLTAESFCQNPARPNGLSNICRKCNSARYAKTPRQHNILNIRKLLVTNPGTGWCARCKQLYQSSAFNWRRETQNHLYPYCKSCLHQDYLSHYDDFIERNRRRRARLKKASGEFTSADWIALKARSPNCYWCARPFTRKRPPTHDHVIPLALGGDDAPSNSVAACSSCNSRKQATLYHPITGQGILL